MFSGNPFAFKGLSKPSSMGGPASDAPSSLQNPLTSGAQAGSFPPLGSGGFHKDLFAGGLSGGNAPEAQAPVATPSAGNNPQQRQQNKHR